MIIAVDFDGTIVHHEFPEIGAVKPFALEILKNLKEQGHRLILWTCRADNPDRKYLTEAIEYLQERGIVFDAVNANVPGLGFETSAKVYADVYIDDRAHNANIDWVEIAKDLARMDDELFEDVEFFLRTFPKHLDDAESAQFQSPE